MRTYQVVLLAVVLGTGAPIYLHHVEHGVTNPHQMGLAFFLWLNAIIAFWEICLFFEIDRIEKQFARFREEYAGRELDRVKDFFGAKLPIGEIFAMKTWAEVWSTYAIFDRSYADRRSYGFFIDVGNGFTTLVPSLICAYGMTYHWLPPRVMGIVTLLLCYQMWYGTLVYFISFVKNGRHRGHSLGNIALFVGLSNGIWLIFPLWGIWAAIRLIYDDSYAVFLH
jgi:hypothetical protein